MTIKSDDQDDSARTAVIRHLNDQFRRTLQGGALLMTAGIVALGDDTQARILQAVRTFEAFDAANDPWHEHDFGAVEVDGEKVFFKIEYYDLARAAQSSDPADPTKTERVMTIMLASEY